MKFKEKINLRTKLDENARDDNFKKILGHLSCKNIFRFQANLKKTRKLLGRTYVGNFKVFIP